MAGKHVHKKKSSSKSGAQRRHKPRRQNLTWLWVSLGVVLLTVAAGFVLIHPQESASVEITPAEAYLKYQQGAFFLDVRSQEEWNELRIAGSSMIPLAELGSRLSEVPGEQEIVLVCLSGRRSKDGVTVLQSAGFAHVFCLTGGIQAWMDAGYPVERGAP